MHHDFSSEEMIELSKWWNYFRDTKNLSSSDAFYELIIHIKSAKINIDYPNTVFSSQTSIRNFVNKLGKYIQLLEDLSNRQR